MNWSPTAKIKHTTFWMFENYESYKDNCNANRFLQFFLTFVLGSDWCGIFGSYANTNNYE